MIHYKDKTWCSKKKCRNQHNCDRFFSEEEKELAIKWWRDGDNSLDMLMWGSTGFPISITHYEDCEYWNGD